MFLTICKCFFNTAHMIFFNTFGLILNQLLPIFLVILTGHLLVRFKFVERKDFGGLEKITYHIIMPAVMIMSLVKIDIKTLPFLSIGGALMGGIVIFTLLAVVFHKPLTKQLAISNAAFTSLYQGGARWNSYVALALCVALFSERGLAVVSIALLAMVPIVNLLSVIILAKYARNEAFSLKGTLKPLATNPFIWSSLVGLILSLLQPPLPTILLNYGSILSAAALAMGLLLVGGGLQLEDFSRPTPVLWIVSGLKLLFMPLLVGSLGFLFGVKQVDFSAMMVCASVPTAAASYILAKSLGGDAPLMAQIITFQTLFAGLTMPFVLTLSAMLWR
jgi:malonate transporter and related proteins